MLKAKINEMLGMPAGKQKLQIEVRQILDRVLVVDGHFHRVIARIIKWNSNISE